jgi:formamidopyrimidine-DNA glycosylase
VCEALWRAGIAPTVSAASLVEADGRPGKRLEALVRAIRAVLEDAIAAGGSTLRDFRAADGASGYFQHSFSVYDREGEPCPRPGCTGTVARLVQSGRSTFYCPVCQS